LDVNPSFIAVVSIVGVVGNGISNGISISIVVVAASCWSELCFGCIVFFSGAASSSLCVR